MYAWHVYIYIYINTHIHTYIHTQMCVIVSPFYLAMAQFL